MALNDLPQRLERAAALPQPGLSYERQTPHRAPDLSASDGLGRIARGSSQPAWDVTQRFLTVPIAVFLLPVIVATAMAVFLQGRGPVLFIHRRIGQHGEAFGCLKFRTMATDAQERLDELLATNPAAREEWARDQKLRDDPRVTRLGRFLRKTSLDELPQLINVLRGEMNLVGPRPILESEIPRYGASFRHYCTVKPGITGLWQVSGRNNTSYRKRVALDVLYARRRSAGLDLLILLRTVPAVLLRQGSC
jgi:lipopolysaccharide/colanic/teichoic acid biosynthesis glycosyltransferase